VKRTMTIRRRAAALCLVLLITGVGVTTAAPRNASTTCNRTGATRMSNNQRQVCVAVGGRRYWVADPRVPSTSPPRPSASRIRPGSDVSGQDLRGLDLTGRDLSTARAARANLEGVSLAGAFIMSLNFGSAVLRRANLSQTTGGWVYFNGADLEGANLTGARLRGSNFDAHVDLGIVRVNLRGARLDSADFSWSTFENADLTGASARGANFTNSNFQQAKVLKADLSNANFQGADLTGADFTGSTVASDWRNQFKDARFQDTTWIDGTKWSSTPTGP